MTADQLVTQLKSGSVTPSQRDAITTVLKFLNRQHSQPLISHRTTLTPSPTPQVSVWLYLCNHTLCHQDLADQKIYAWSWILS